jgi:hypothetical protein
MLPNPLMACVDRETHGTMKLDLDRISRLSEFNPFFIQAEREPVDVLFDFHPDSYVVPILKEENMVCIDFTQARRTDNRDVKRLIDMYNDLVYTLHAFAFMFTYEEKGLIVLWAQQLAVPPTFNRAQTNALLEEALRLEAEGSHFAFTTVFHPAQVIELFYENQKIATAVGGHSFVMIIPVEKKWRLQLRKNKKEPEDDFEMLRRKLAVCKEEVSYLQNYFHKNGISINDQAYL